MLYVSITKIISLMDPRFINAHTDVYSFSSYYASAISSLFAYTSFGFACNQIMA